MKHQTKQKSVLSVREVMEMTSGRLAQINEAKEPTQAAINAAKAHCSLVGAYLGPVRLALQIAKLSGAIPDVSYLGINCTPVKQITNQ